MSDSRSALGYVAGCSEMSLEAFRISQMGSAAKLRREVFALVDQWVQAEVGAAFSRLMVECRRTLPPSSQLLFHNCSQKYALGHLAIVVRPTYFELLATRGDNVDFVCAASREAGMFRLHCASDVPAEDSQSSERERRPRRLKAYAAPRFERYRTNRPMIEGIFGVQRGPTMSGWHELAFQLPDFVSAS